MTRTERPFTTDRGL